MYERKVEIRPKHKNKKNRQNYGSNGSLVGDIWHKYQGKKHFLRAFFYNVKKKCNFGSAVLSLVEKSIFGHSKVRS